MEPRLFDLFEAEERALQRGEELLATLPNAGPEAVAEGVSALLSAFKKSYREQRRMVRLSDRLQEQLATLNQELDRRRTEAEDALERLRETQETLIQSEKLASLGALVAGVAHEINTPVGIALSCASHLVDATAGLERDLAGGNLGRSAFSRYLETARETSHLVQANCERAAALIRSFKQVAVDRTSAERRVVGLAAYLDEVLNSLGHRVRQAGHQVLVDIPPGLEVDSYPGVLSQVLTNLVMNSLAHAFEPGQAGTLRLSARREGDDVVMLYADDGRGIPEENRGRIFDPFFTTGRGEGGTGLGLHIVYNLITGTLGGSIHLDEAEAGVRFRIRFPAVLPPGPQTD